MSDLIKREDAIREVSEPFDEYMWDGVLHPIRYIVDTLKAVPSADRPRGEWAIHFDKVENGMGGTYRERRWYCSACGKWQTYGETDFCPNCGCAMTKE